MSLFAHFRQKRLVGGALVLAITQFGASLAGLVRDRILTSTFPDLDVVDVYIAAFRPSDLLFQMTVMAAFSVALVPMLAQSMTKGKTRDMDELISGATTAAALAFGAVALLMAVFFPLLAPFLVRFEGESLELYIRFGRLALLTNFLFVFGNAYGQYLITIQKYVIYGITPILYTCGTIAGTLLLVADYGAMAPMIGTIGGAVVYVIVRFIGMLLAGHRPFFRLWHPDLKIMGWLMLPRMFALGALQLQLLLFDTVASGLDTGAITINAYARNFQSVAVGVVGIALAQSAFSLLSQAAAKKEAQRFWIYLRKGILTIVVLTIPCAIALVLLAPIAARLVNLTHVLPVFSFCLFLYAISIPMESLNHLLLRSFYALHDSLIPSIASVIGGVMAIFMTWFLAPRIGVYALPIGFTAGQVFLFVCLALLLPFTARRVFPEGWMQSVLSFFTRKSPVIDEI